MAAVPLGWIDWPERSPVMQQAHHAALAAMPVYAAPPLYEASFPEPLRLTDSWTHARVVAALGRPFRRWHQLTGSCVGAGAGNAMATLAFLDVLRRGDPERLLLPFWLAAYGESRRLAGMRGRGEGSLGSTMARAAVSLGFPDWSLSGLPVPTEGDGLAYTEAVEYQWSDGAALADQWRQEATRHPVRTVSPCGSAADVRAAVANGYPVTLAYGSYVGRPRVEGSPPVLLGTFDSRGGHQVSIQGVWDHPSLGPLYLQPNQWPASVYPADPAGGPPCSCWLREADVDRVCRGGEVYAWSQYDGYPAQPDVPALLDWRV